MANTKSLKAIGNALSSAKNQLKLLNDKDFSFNKKPSFKDRLTEQDLFPLKPRTVDTLQINLGKMCNQVCEHCHVDAGPDRKEIMTTETMSHCLNAIKNGNIKIVDLTGGAPEMNPNFRWFIEELSKLKIKIIVRSNLTIIRANKKYYDLPEFFKKHKVEVVSSLPCYTESNVDKQRGKGVFKDSIQALIDLNSVGYGKEETDLKLNLVFNPGGPNIAPDQSALEGDYKTRLKEDFGIEFNNLFTITNLPISRFLDYLQVTGKTDEYLNKLLDNYNPKASEEVMCRDMLSVSWEGKLYDCDFNQMLELPIETKQKTIKDFSKELALDRNIIVNQHCFGCTAGAGSSCGGSLT